MPYNANPISPHSNVPPVLVRRPLSPQFAPEHRLTVCAPSGVTLRSWAERGLALRPVTNPLGAQAPRPVFLQDPHRNRDHRSRLQQLFCPQPDDEIDLGGMPRGHKTGCRARSQTHLLDFFFH